MAVGQALSCSNTLGASFDVSQLDIADDWLMVVVDDG